MFAERLKKAMHYRGKRAIDVALDTGISKSLISRYLNNQSQPSQLKVAILADYLKVNASYLVGLSDDLIVPNIKVNQTLDRISKKENMIKEIDEIISWQDEETVETLLRIAKSLDKRAR